MLTTDVENTRESLAGEPSGRREETLASASSKGKQSRLAKALSIEWLGQTVASLCWIVSMFSYGITSTGDWLQLAAASAWLVANIASIVIAEDN